MDSPAEKTSQARTIAAIDIGSNAVRMVVGQVLPDGKLEVLERMQRAVRLGQDTFLAGRLSQRTMSAAVSVLRNYRRVLETYRVGHVRAVATSAVREAGNADAFLDRVFMATNLDVEVIEPAEESRLTVGAVLNEWPHGGAPAGAAGGPAGAAEIARGRTLIADVGGGSALLTLLHDGQIAASGSYRLGSIRLQETLSTTTEPAQRAAELLRHQIAGVVTTIKSSLPLKDVRCFLAVGGDARFAARQIGKPAESAGGAELSTIGAADFDRFVRACAAHTAAELARTYGLPFADAETLVPALLAYQCLLHETRARRMVVSNVSMRDGLLLDLARSVLGREDPDLADAIIHSAMSIGEKFHYDAAHALHVAELATGLFDALAREHGLGPRHRLLLRVAAILHEIGSQVSTRAHHKHSYYLIANSEVFGLRKDELAVVAHVARYHRRSPPKPTHVEYMSLPREKRMLVSKLAAILRVADALDHGHAQQIRNLRFEHRPDELVISVPGVSDLALERLSLAAKADLFEEIYGMKVRLEEAPAGRPAPPAEASRT